MDRLLVDLSGYYWIFYQIIDLCRTCLRITNLQAKISFSYNSSMHHVNFTILSLTNECLGSQDFFRNVDQYVSKVPCSVNFPLERQTVQLPESLQFYVCGKVEINFHFHFLPPFYTQRHFFLYQTSQL